MEAFGANIEVSGTSQGDLKFGGANVILSGRFLDVVDGVAANLVISGTFEDDVNVKAARITIAPTAVIKGDFAYATPLFERKEGSLIMGQVVPLDSERGKIWQRIRHAHEGDHEYLARGMFWIISTIAFIIVGLLVNYSLPKQTEEIVSGIAGPIWRNLGIGLLFLIVGPLCIILAVSTAIGIPAGIILAFICITMIYTSRVYVALWIGRKLLGSYSESFAVVFFWPFVVGTVIIGILLLIPIAGWLLRLFLLLVGLGAMSQVIWKSARPAKKVGCSGKRNT